MPVAAAQAELERHARDEPSTTPVPTISARTGTTPSSTYPVRNVPVSAPAVPIADSRPTSEPLDATSRIVARTMHRRDRGEDRRGQRERDEATAGSPPSPPGARERRAQDSPTIGTLAIAASPAEHERRPQQGRGPDAVRDAAAGPRPERDAREDDRR